MITLHQLKKFFGFDQEYPIYCPFCWEYGFKSQRGLNQHIRRSPECLQKVEEKDQELKMEFRNSRYPNHVEVR